VTISGVSPFLAKTPVDVWNFLVHGGSNGAGAAAENWAYLGHHLVITLGDAGLGFVFGVVFSVIASCLFVLVTPLQYMFLPLAMVLRTVPLLATAPIIFLIFGNGPTTVAVIGTVVVFFPILANVTLGLRSISVQQVDVVRVYGGSRWATFARVAVPSAMPSFFAALRIAVPASVAGAMLYEWLFAFEGLGAAVVLSRSESRYDQLWAIVAVAVLAAVVLYLVMVAIETFVLRRFGPFGEVAE
jgi:ABC-type nitrate/sulfonate/bicarbonate transport system permease component